MTFIKRTFLFAVVAMILYGCFPPPPPSPPPTATASCIKPATELEQPYSNYLPLATGNQWTYEKTVSQEVWAWETYQAQPDSFVLGPVENIVPGKTTEIYKVLGPATLDGYGPAMWEIEVSDLDNARDGRYGGIGIQAAPDNILWGRVASSDDIIQIDEVLFWSGEGFNFIGEAEHKTVLLIEVVPDDVEATIPSGHVTYYTPSSLTTVKVPAGKFECVLEMRITVETEQGKWTTISHYAPGVGLVREKQEDAQGKTNYLMQLTAFEVKPTP